MIREFIGSMGSDAVLQREFEKQQQVNQGTKIWEEVFF